MMTDLRIAIRGLGRSKGFAAAAALTLALGIAATTTIFSVLYGVMFRPLPYRDVRSLVIIEGEKAYSTGPRIMNFSAPELEPFTGAVRAFSSVAMSGATSLTYRSDSAVEFVPGATVSGDFFSTLGTPPVLGRTIGDETEPNIVISNRLWRRLFDGSTDVLGRSIALADSANVERLYTIVGVMPPEFQLPYARTDAWRSLAFARAMGDGRVRELGVGGHQIYARFKDDVTFDAASADAARVVDQVLKPHFTTSRIDMYAKVTPLNASVRGTMAPTLWVLMAAVTLVLLAACANVANLVLTRQSTRAREISVRLALGSPRARLIGFLLFEVMVVAIAGAVLGLITSAAAIRGLRWLQPAQLPRLDAIAVDVPVVVFATVTAAAATSIAGLVPAWLATRSDASIAMTTGPRGEAVTPLSRSLRSGLVIAQIAVSIVLLVSASLLTRSVLALLATDVGVNTENVIAANLDVAAGRVVTPERQRQIAADLEQRIAAIPSVRAAGVGSGVPPAGELMRVSFILSNGRSTDSHMVTAVPASPGYFSTLQIRLSSGRTISDADTATSEPVVVLNREAARRFFGADDPLGRTLPLMGKQVTIVGVVENVKYTGIAAGPESVIYTPFAQMPLRVSVVFARTDGDPAAIASDLRAVIRSYDPGIGVPRVQSLSWLMSDAASQPRMRATMLSAIALVTLLIAAVGLYGVVAYSTARRTTEIGVRMAIGARHSDVMRLVLKEGIWLAIGGITLGLGLAWWSARLLAAFLYGVTANDLPTFALAATSLLAVTVTACAVPAWRASRIDPASALRAE